MEEALGDSAVVIFSCYFVETGEYFSQAVNEVPESGGGDADQTTGSKGQLGTSGGPHQLSVRINTS